MIVSFPNYFAMCSHAASNVWCGRFPEFHVAIVVVELVNVACVLFVLFVCLLYDVFCLLVLSLLAMSSLGLCCVSGARSVQLLLA